MVQKSQLVAWQSKPYFQVNPTHLPQEKSPKWIQKTANQSKNLYMSKIAKYSQPNYRCKQKKPNSLKLGSNQAEASTVVVYTKTHLQSLRKFFVVNEHRSVWRSTTMSPTLVTMRTDILASTPEKNVTPRSKSINLWPSAAYTSYFEPKLRFWREEQARPELRKRVYLKKISKNTGIPR